MKEQLPLFFGLCLLWTLVLEAVTLFARFRLGISARDLAARYERWTLGVRLHVAFVGVLLLALAPWIGGPLATLHLAAFALGLVLSSALHHLVLRLRTGDHELHVCAKGPRPANLRAELGTFSPSGALRYGLLWGVLFEALTVFSRFGLAFESQRDTAALGQLTFGIRIHHGYVGVLFLGLAWLLRTTPSRRNAALALGVALLFSDLVHHFAVLWPITGTHQFFLVYD
ncbi:MAG: hypothetical protein JKY65_29590 [Planctomycetes bacterium]|nr:hypothetical protein [Planctomycetota bacterium]